MVSSASSDDNARPNVSCQDVSNSSIPAPITLVAVRDKHPPARAPYAPYSEGLEKSREGPATESSLTGVASFTHLAFTEVVDRVRVYESSVGYAPDSYLTFVYSDKFCVAISGDSLVDSVCSFRQRLTDPNDPVPGTSQGGNSVVRFLYRLVASSVVTPVVWAIPGITLGWGWLLQGLVLFLPLPIATFISLPPVLSPAPSSFPPSVSFSLPSGSFPSPYPSFPTPSPAPAPAPLAFSLSFHPPFTSGVTPSVPSSFYFPSLRFCLLLLLRFRSLHSLLL